MNVEMSKSLDVENSRVENLGGRPFGAKRRLTPAEGR